MGKEETREPTLEMGVGTISRGHSKSRCFLKGSHGNYHLECLLKI